MANNEILESIDNIDSIVLESEMNVIESLLDSYEKTAMILENYQGDNLDAFEIFNESFVMEADDDTSKEDKVSRFRQLDKNGKKENIFKSILMVIPRLIKWLAQSIKKVWNKRPVAKLKRECKCLQDQLDASDAKHREAMDAMDALTEKYDGDLNKMKNERGVYMKGVRDSLNKLRYENNKEHKKLDEEVFDNTNEIRVLRYDVNINKIDNKVRDNNIDYIEKNNKKDIDDIKKKMVNLDDMRVDSYRNIKRVEQMASAYILAKENKYVSSLNIKATIENCKKHMKFVDKLTNATMFKPGTIPTDFDLDFDWKVRDKRNGNATDKGKHLYSLDEFTEGCELIQSMYLEMVGKCEKAVPVVEKRLNDYIKNLEAKNKDVNKNQNDKINAANRQIWAIKTHIRYMSNDVSEISAAIKFASNYVEMYNNLYKKFIVNMAPNKDILYLKNNKENDEVNAPFNKD